MSSLGEAAWTARDLLGPYDVRNFEGRSYGRRHTEEEAVRLRDALAAEGVECWIEKEQAVAALPYITDRDPGDENDNRREPTC